MKKIKLIASFALVATMLVPTAALANNHADTLFDFSYYHSGAKLTDVRLKKDNSYSYMRCTSSKSSGRNDNSLYYYGTVYGAKKSTDTYVNPVYKNKKSTRLRFKAGTYHYMENYLYEKWGLSCARIYMESGNGTDVTFTGLWSPDSI